MTALLGLIYPFLFLVLIFLGKEYIIVNADLVVISAFILVFFLLKKQLTPSLLETFRHRRLSIRQALLRYTLLLLNIQWILHGKKIYFLEYLDFYEDILLGQLSQEFLSLQREKALVLLQANSIRKVEIKKFP